MGLRMRAGRCRLGLWLILSRAVVHVQGTAMLNAPGGVAFSVCYCPTGPYSFEGNSTGTGFGVYGYEIDLFKRVASAISLNYTFRSFGSDLYLDALMASVQLPASDPGHCDILAGTGLNLLQTNYSGGVRFTSSVFRSGMSVVTRVSVVTSDLWAFGRVFDSSLWIALCVTACLLAFLVYALERDYKHKGLGKIKYDTKVRPGIYEALFQSYSKLVNNSNGIPAASLGAKLISVGWGFVILVCISSYTAGLTASLTEVAFRSSIQSYKDLSNPGLVVCSWDYYQGLNTFAPLGFRPVGMPWNSDDDVAAMVQAVADGKCDAAILDTAPLTDQVNNRCDVQVVGPQVLFTEIVWQLHHDTVSRDVVDAINGALADLESAGVYEQLQTTYVSAQECDPSDFASNQITFYDVRGLFVLLGCLTALGLLLAALPHLSRRLEADIRQRSDFSVSGHGGAGAGGRRRWGGGASGSGLYGNAVPTRTLSGRSLGQHSSGDESGGPVVSLSMLVRNKLRRSGSPRPHAAAPPLQRHETLSGQLPDQTDSNSPSAHGGGAMSPTLPLSSLRFGSSARTSSQRPTFTSASAPAPGPAPAARAAPKQPPQPPGCWAPPAAQPGTPTVTAELDPEPLFPPAAASAPDSEQSRVSFPKRRSSRLMGGAPPATREAGPKPAAQSAGPGGLQPLPRAHSSRQAAGLAVVAQNCVPSASGNSAVPAPCGSGSESEPPPREPAATAACLSSDGERPPQQAVPGKRLPSAADAS